MIKVFVGNAKYQLSDESGNTMTIGPNKFEQIPDAFAGDLTYRLAVQAGTITPYTTAKDGDKAAEAAAKKEADKAKKATEKAEKKADKPAKAAANSEELKDGAK